MERTSNAERPTLNVERKAGMNRQDAKCAKVMEVCRRDMKPDPIRLLSAPILTI
jgi:hypothetical protein